MEQHLDGAVQGLHPLAMAALESIGTLRYATEREFVDLGAKLAEFRRRADELAARATDAVAFVDEHAAAEFADSLTRALDAAQDSFTKAEERTTRERAVLAHTVELLDDIERPVFRFASSMKLLSILATYIRLEGARLTNGRQGFHALADDVEALCAGNRERIERLTAHRSRALTLAVRALTRMDAGEEERADDVRAMLEGCERALEALDTGQTSLANGSRVVAEAMDGIVAAVWRTVTGLQSQDIVRQRLEHVAEAVVLLGEPGIEPTDAAGLLDLQRAQVEAVGETVTRAIDGVRSSLISVSDGIARLIPSAEKAADAAERVRRQLLAEVDRGTRRVLGAVDAYVAESADLNETVRTVGGAVREMGELLADMEQVTRDVKRAAMNTMILAHSEGGHGEVLGTIAELIGQLSQEADMGNRAIIGSLGTLRGAGEALAGAESNVHEHGEAVTRLRDAFAEVDDGLHVREERLAAIWTGFPEAVEALRLEVACAAARLDAETRAADVLTYAQGELAAARALYHVGDRAEILDPAVLGTLAALYSTAEERVVHEAVLGAAPGEPVFAPAIPAADVEMFV